MQRLFRRSTPIILSGLLALFGAAACGDDDGGDGATDSGDDADDGADDGADGPDAGSEPDAAPPVTRSGLLAITDTTITNPGLPGEPIQGGVVSMNYIDDQSVTVAPVEGFDTYPPIGSCLVTVYGEGDQEGTSVDEGPVRVTGTANGEFACGYSKALEEYACQSTNPDIAGGVPGNATGATLELGSQTLILGGAKFTPEMQGMTISLTGFGAQDGQYPIIAVVNGFTLQLAGIEAEVDGGAEATFTTFVGASPIPNAAAFNFLDDGENPVTVAKEASDIVPAFEVTASARGEGFALAAESAQPHELPTASPATDAVVFSCGDSCGADPAPASGQLNVMVINGETTDGELVDPSPISMPAATNYATFQCIGTKDSVTIPAAAMDAILGTTPTRIQVTVGRFVASIQSVPDAASSNVVLGHSLTGFTTVEAPPKLARPTK